MKYNFSIGKEKREIDLKNVKDRLEMELDGKRFSVKPIGGSSNSIQLNIDGRNVLAYIAKTQGSYQVCIEGITFDIVDSDSIEQSDSAEVGGLDGDEVKAPMPGKVIKVFVKEGDTVEAGSKVAILEAMKMENELLSPKKAVIGKVLFKEGDLVEAGQRIVELIKKGDR